MLYIERDQGGRIVALHDRPTRNASEQKAAMDEEVLEFVKKNVDTDSLRLLLSLSDSSLIRIIEDLVDLLIKKNIILFTDLPEQAQVKIRERKRVREELVSQSLMVENII
jgi:CRISPR/Cas system-associated protein endoribonuclease Cas2